MMKMIKINKENKSAIIELNKDIYSRDSISESCKEFSDFFNFEIVVDVNYFVINIIFNDNVDVDDYEKTCLELCNYIFVLMKDKNEV